MSAISKIHVLIVEDEAILNKAYQKILSKEGYRVSSATDGMEALKVVAATLPNIILLDLRMAKLDGIGFLKKFSKNKDADKVKIVVFSNYDSEQEIDEAFKYGAAKYVLKAWASPKELVELVRDLSTDL